MRLTRDRKVSSRFRAGMFPWSSTSSKIRGWFGAVSDGLIANDEAALEPVCEGEFKLLAP